MAGKDGRISLIKFPPRNFIRSLMICKRNSMFKVRGRMKEPLTAVIYHGLQHLYKSEDGGDTWKMISPDLSYNDRSKMGVYPYLIYHQAISAIAEGDQAGQLYAGTDDGRVWLTMDDGANWKEITKG